MGPTEKKDKRSVIANNKKYSFNFSFLFLAVLAIMMLQNVMTQKGQVATISYDEFERHLSEGNVEEVVVGENQLWGTLKEVPGDGKRQFMTNRVEPELADVLSKGGIKFSRAVENTFLRDLMSWVVPSLIFFMLWLFVMRRLSSRGGLGGGFMAVGKSKAKVYVETDTKTSFDDVAGVDEAKSELKEIVDFLKDPRDYGRLGARVPKGVLLVGPPGTGKTLLAKAVAGEAGVPFFSISGSEFVEMFVGVGAARVKDLFAQARSQSPCIIFIDELDALGRARSSGPMSGGHDEKEQTLNQLLVELDGFDSSSGIVIIAASNRPEILDPALLRSGRFDRQVLVDRPDRKGRIEILKVHVKKVRIGDRLDLESVAALTAGFTGADLANLVNEAALVATRRNASSVELADFTAAIERIVAGLEKKNRLLNPMERKVVAHHEMGHALVACSIPGCDPVHKVSIIPRGIGALGYTIQRPTEDRYLMTMQELEDKMSVLLGGRAAEYIVFQHYSTGASDDISKATDIARSMVTRYGMEEKLGHASYETDNPRFLGGGGQDFFRSRMYSEETAREIDNAVKTLVNKAFRTAVAILRANYELLTESAQLLLHRETLDEKELAPLFAKLVPFAGSDRKRRDSFLTEARRPRETRGEGPETDAIPG